MRLRFTLKNFCSDLFSASSNTLQRGALPQFRFSHSSLFLLRNSFPHIFATKSTITALAGSDFAQNEQFTAVVFVEKKTLLFVYDRNECKKRRKNLIWKLIYRLKWQQIVLSSVTP